MWYDNPIVFAVVVGLILIAVILFKEVYDLCR